MSLNILVLDDHETLHNRIASIISLTFKNPQISVMSTYNQKAAKKICSKTNPALIISDINLNPTDLSNVEGLEFITHLRQKGYTGTIIATSTNPSFEKKAKKAGADYFTHKRELF
ncbi:response regulator [Candidatus Woesearchaeota archaeon]|nr:response regulator [Candidatus Woesearchaeota archaeon]